MQLIPGAVADKVWDVLCDAVIGWKIDDNGSTCTPAAVTPSGWTRWPETKGSISTHIARCDRASGRLSSARANAAGGSRHIIRFSSRKGCASAAFCFAPRRLAEIFMKPLKYEEDHVAGMDFEPNMPAQSDCLSALVY
jgi:hypothetical protein